MDAKKQVRGAVGNFDKGIKAIFDKQTHSHPEVKLHAPATAYTEPRTDVPAELLAQKPWLRFYQPNVPLDIEVTDERLSDYVKNAARDFPHNPAIIFYGNRISYKELNEQVERFAAGLWDIGVRKGDRVALLLPNCPQFVIAFYAAQRIGAIVVACNPTYTDKELTHLVVDSAPKVMVTISVLYKLAEKVRELVEIPHLIVGAVKDYFPPALQVVFTMVKEKKEGHKVELQGPSVHSWQNFMHASLHKNAPQVEISPDDIALYQYTGGTTGVPKAAMLSHRNLTSNTKMGLSWLGAAEPGKDITLCAIPFFHVYGLTVAMNLSVLSAAAMVLVPRFVPLDILKTIERFRPTLFPGVPAMYIALINHPQVNNFDLSSIEACLSGAAPLPVEVQTKFEKLTGARLIEGFGMTELSPMACATPVFGIRKEGSIGIPMPGISAKIVDVDTGQVDLPIGEIGELVISGPNVMQGYYNRPEETGKTIHNGWLYTGDIARMDEDGYLYIVDRKKDMILSNGFNVYPRDVEEVLYQHPAVKECVVIGAPNERGDETVKAFIVLKDDVTATEQEIMDFAKQSLTSYKAPRKVEFRESLPKTLIGKHLRRVLVEEEKQKLAAKKAAHAESQTTATEAATTHGKHEKKGTGLHIPEEIGHTISNIASKLPKIEDIHLPKVNWPHTGKGEAKAEDKGA